MRNPDSSRRAWPAGLLAAACVLAWAPASLAQQAAQPPRTGLIASLKLSNSSPIQIESDKLEVHDADSTAVFTGNVAVTQGTTLLKSGKMTVFYTPSDSKRGTSPIGSSGIDRLEVTDKVYVKSDDQVATGDKGTFDMKSEVLTLAGAEVVLSQGPNVLVGCKLTVQMRTGFAQVDGCVKAGAAGARVMMSITPSQAPTTPAAQTNAQQ